MKIKIINKNNFISIFYYIMEWNINIIKNKNSKYDFRLVGNNY